MREDFRIDLKHLSELKVPDADDSLLAAFSQIESARVFLETWGTDLEEVITRAFASEDLAAAKNTIIEDSRRLRLRVDAARQIDDFAHTVRTQFPYPVAYRYREVTALSTTSNARATYNAALGCAEALITYLASVGLCLAQGSKGHDKVVAVLRDQMGKGGRAIGEGTWWSLIGSLRGAANTSHESLAPFAAFAASPDVIGAHDRLTQRRNAEAHQRSIDELDLADGLRDLLADLRCLLEASEFLVDLKLLHITSARYNSFSTTSDLEYRALSGDHPIVPTSSLQTGQFGIEVGSLYCQEETGQLRLLRPFLATATCPKCRSQSVFHLDKVTGRGVETKSFEHGHVLVSEDSALICELVGVD